MAGHSKWANIRRRKSANDAKRGKLFTKLIREIITAAKEGGGELEANARLRLAVQNAKGANMPKDTIERAIKKGGGGDAVAYRAVTYEGYAPHGVAVFVECMTDNLNRTVSAVRAAFTKYGGSLGKNGSLDFIFEKKGIFSIKVGIVSDEEAFTLELIDANAEEVEKEGGYFHVTCSLEDFGNVQKKLEVLRIASESADLQRIPNTLVDLENGAFHQVMKLIEVLEDNDDVQKVYHNIAINDQQLERLEQ